MINFPDQLAMMSQKLDLTVRLGDAFIEQQADVMNTIQILRNKANDTGNLKSKRTAEKWKSLQLPPLPPANTTIVNVQAGSAQPPTTVVQQPPQIITIQSPRPAGRVCAIVQSHSGLRHLAPIPTIHRPPTIRRTMLRPT